MATAPKRRRKSCFKCNLELSDRHLRRHVAHCTFEKYISCEKSSCIQNENVEIHSYVSEDDVIFPNEDGSINHEKYISTKSYQLKKICSNIDEDDAKTFFDVDLEMNDESFDSSGSDYESNFFSSTDEEMEDGTNDIVSADECNNFLTRFICTILVL